MLCTGLLCDKNVNADGSNGSFYGSNHLLFQQVIAVVCVAPCVFTVTLHAVQAAGVLSLSACLLTAKWLPGQM
jgi:ammonia channel protein AmtB